MKIAKRKFDSKMFHRYNDLVLPLKLQSPYALNINARLTRFHAFSEEQSDLMLLYLLYLISLSESPLNGAAFFIATKGGFI
ncbi:hypothetical protein A7975_27435 [Bacillus sp. FJAT-26390]|nr:hypothetical protein A7975_27435 [Bacillus sp. FJAT-26390]